MLTPVKMHKKAKYAIDSRKLPEETRVFFMKSFGCVRKVKNLLVDSLYHKLEASGYTNGTDIPSSGYPEVSEFKKLHPYLKEVDSLALANAKQDFLASVRRFNQQERKNEYTKRAVRRDKSSAETLSFRGLKGMPKFHSRARGHFSYKTNCQYPKADSNSQNPTIRLDGNKLHLPKLKEDVVLVMHRPLPEDAVIGNVTVSMDTDGAFFVSIEYTHAVNIDLSLRKAALKDDASILEGLSTLGLDYSQKDFYVDSEGRKANYPHWYRQSEEKPAKLQRKLSRMIKGSNNYNKTLNKIRKLHTKIKNQRADFIKKEASYLAGRYDVIAVEDIDLRAMGGALSLGKNLHDKRFGMFRTFLTQKLEAKGSVLVKVGKWYSSTKTCSKCGFVNKDIKLGISEWDCPNCGAHHNRDENAAINIRNEGERILLEYLREWLVEKEKADKRALARANGRRKKKTA